MKVTPKKTFLLRQEGEPGQRKDVIAEKGKPIDVTDIEHKQFSRHFEEAYEKKKK